MPAGAEGKAPQMAVIQAAFDDTQIEEVQATHRALLDCVANLKGIEVALAARVPPVAVPKLDSLRHVVEQADKHVQEALARRGYGIPDAAAGAGVAPAAPAAARVSGSIASKEDVIRTLDRICEFYEKTEPSSPVPLLLKRAKRLVGKTFVDIIRDMTPDAMTQVDMISGAANDPAAGAPKPA
jgi:type VI secretion system protein ImpA